MWLMGFSAITLSSLLICLKLVKSDDDLYMYCNTTSCQSCGPKLRSQPQCKSTGYVQDSVCLIEGKGLDIPHDIGIDVKNGKQLEKGAHMHHYETCSPPLSSSFMRFEVVLAILLGISLAVIKWRRRKIQSLI